MMNSGYGGMFMGMIFLIVLIAAAIWWFTKGAGSKDHGRLTGETPLDILKKRYAKGEITKDEFEKMKKDLEA
jgi:putative membrane protein